MSRKHKVLWTGPALGDLRDIRNYVSQDDPAAAKRLAEKIRNGVLRLADHPSSGRVGVCRLKNPSGPKKGTKVAPGAASI